MLDRYKIDYFQFFLSVETRKKKPNLRGDPVLRGESRAQGESCAQGGIPCSRGIPCSGGVLCSGGDPVLRGESRAQGGIPCSKEYQSTLERRSMYFVSTAPVCASYAFFLVSRSVMQ